MKVAWEKIKFNLLNQGCNIMSQDPSRTEFPYKYTMHLLLSNCKVCMAYISLKNQDFIYQVP